MKVIMINLPLDLHKKELFITNQISGFNYLINHIINYNFLT